MKKNLIILGFLLLLPALLLLLSGGCAVGNNADDRLTVAVSIVPQAALIREIAGDSINVVILVPPGKSPENYAPVPQDMEALSRSALYFAIGVPAEESSILPWLESGNKQAEIVDLAAAVREVYPEREFSPGQRDPHIWLSPQRAALMVEIMAEKLAAADKKNSGTYRENARRYFAELNDLDREIAAQYEGLNENTFIIYHPSLGYYADDYGLEMVAIEDEGKNASPADLQRIIDLAREKKLKTVFYQAEHDSRQARTLAAEISGNAVQINPLASDYIENLRDITAKITASLQ